MTSSNIAEKEIVDEDQKFFFAATFATLKLFIPFLPFLN